MASQYPTDHTSEATYTVQAPARGDRERNVHRKPTCKCTPSSRVGSLRVPHRVRHTCSSAPDSTTQGQDGKRSQLS